MCCENDDALLSEEERAHYEERIPRLFRGRGALVASLVTILLVLGATGVSIVFGVKLFNHLNFADFHPTIGTILWQTEQARWNTIQPSAHVYSQPEYVVLRTNDGSPWTGAGASVERKAQLYLITLTVEEALKKDQELSWMIPRVRCFYCDGYNNHTLVAGDRAVFVFEFLSGKAKPFVTAADKFMRKLDTTLLAGTSWTVSGLTQLQDALTKSILPDLGSIDMVAVPVGLLIFAVFVRSGHALLVPIFCIVTSVGIALGGSYAISRKKDDSDSSSSDSSSGSGITLTGFAPELMLSLCVSLVIDFSLFLFARLRESHLALPPHIRAQASTSRMIAAFVVWTSFSRVAHNISISAISIAASLGLLAVLPTDFVKSIALVCCFGVVATLVSSLTIMPALAYLLYPVAYENCFNRACSALAGRVSVMFSGGAAGEEGSHSNNNVVPNDSEVSLIGSSSYAANNSNNNASTRERDDDDDDDPPQIYEEKFGDEDAASPLVAKSDEPHGAFARMARAAVAWPKLVLLTVSLCVLPFLVILGLRFGYDCNYLASAPHTGSAYKDIGGGNGFSEYVDTLQIFRNKIDSPFYLFFRSADDTPFATADKFWPVMRFAVRAAAADPRLHLTLDDIDSVVYFENAFLDFNESARLFAASSSSSNNNTRARAYLTLFKHLSAVQDPLQAHFALVALRPNALTAGGRYVPTWGQNNDEYLEAVQALCVRTRAFAAEHAGIELHADGSGEFVGWLGANDDTWSVMVRVMTHFDLVVALTLATLFVVVLLLVRSVYLAVVMLFSCGLSVAFAFGALTLTVSFDWLHGVWYPLAYVNKIYWIVCLLSFSVSCCVCFDYCIFVAIRCKEFRETGQFSNSESIVRAVARTGPVVAVAACILCVAIGALVFANCILLAQFALCIALAVIFDSLVARPLVMPAMIAAVPEAVVFWPRTMPDVEASSFDEF